MWLKVTKNTAYYNVELFAAVKSFISRPRKSEFVNLNYFWMTFQVKLEYLMTLNDAVTESQVTRVQCYKGFSHCVCLTPYV